jgi:uncharacterized membrane protein
MRGIETPERSERREPRHAPEIVDGPETVADRQPRRRRWRIGIAIAVAFCVAGLLAYWQIHAFRAAFNTLIPYAPSVLPAVVAGFAIRFKDWNNYRPIHIRWVLILIVFLSMLGGIIYQNHQRSERAAADARTAAAQQAQVDNTALFLIRLNDLSSKMTKLETDAMSEKFKKDLDSVRAELKQTQDHLLHTQAELMKANTPKPKARLAFSFFNIPSPQP